MIKVVIKKEIKESNEDHLKEVAFYLTRVDIINFCKFNKFNLSDEDIEDIFNECKLPKFNNSVEKVLLETIIKTKMRLVNEYPVKQVNEEKQICNLDDKECLNCSS
jgi:hypothetical protein